jgi:tetratricopeptide (TPR) repeat protein
MTERTMRDRTSLVVTALALFALNTAYLWAYATPSLFYYTNVVFHMALGIALGAVLGRQLLRAWRGVGLLVRGAAALVAAGGFVGIVIMVIGAAAHFRWLLPLHIALSVAGAVPLGVYGVAKGLRSSGGRQRTVFAATCGVVIVATAAAIVVAARSGAEARARYRITNSTATVPLSMNQEGRGPTSPFFPSSSDTNVHGIIPATFFLTSQSCGRCHADIYKQWNSSAHHFSSFNNQWYRKSIEYMQDVVGTQPSKWCAGCHDHAVFFNGRFDRPIKEQIDTTEAQAGLSCTSCHAITHVRSTMGQGDFEIEYPPLHDLAASNNPIARFLHDQLTYIDPEPHRRIFLKPFHTEQAPEFCSSCHKVHLDVPVNKYRWSRGFNDYDNWQASGISGQGARSFYYPPAPMRCTDCHMPLVKSDDPAAKNGMIRSHRFAGANTALPFVNKDPEQLKAVQDFLRAGQVSIDVFGLVRAPESPAAAESRPDTSGEQKLSSMFGVGEESMNVGGSARNYLAETATVIAPIDKVKPAVRRGESVRIEVVVRTRKVGHFFPGGTVDAFDVWVELEAVDDRGRTILHSGAAGEDGNGPVDPGAHFYRSLLLDEHGNPINKRNAWMARSVAYVRLIPPGAADTIHYRLLIPPDAGDHITLKAKLNYRKFAWWNTQWAFGGIRDPAQKDYSLTPAHDDGRWIFSGDTSKVSGHIKAIPEIPTTVMASAQAELTVLPKEAPVPETKPLLDKSVRERWNDYGIGLLLQGDIRNAEATFLKVTQMDPGYADGYVNVGRTRVQEGSMTAAEAILRKALQVNPELASAHFFLATALKSLGRYDEAIEHLRTASAKYPRDRVVLNQLGRVLFLKRQFREAIGTFTNVIAIDPEDLQAHYNLMLCYQGLGDAESAARERTLYERFKADEASQAITGPYRQLHEADNNERQQIHEHRTGPLSASVVASDKPRATGAARQ